MTNLSAHLLPLLNSQAFITSGQSPSHTLNLTQTHALAYATLAGEILESFYSLGLGTHNDGLIPIKEGLENLAARAANPLIAAVRKDLTTLIDALEFPPSVNGSPKFGPSGSAKATLHPSIIALHNSMPLYARALSRYTAPFPCVAQIQGALTALLIGVTWRALVALAHRNTPQGSPFLSPKTVSPAASPPSSPAMKKKQLAPFTISRPSTRPPSPVRSSSPSASCGDDARTVHDLLSTLPRPRSGPEAEEAVDAALRGLSALSALLFICPSLPGVDELEKLTEDIPTLICLPVVIRAYVSPTGHSVASAMGMTEDEYRQTCLCGFSRAEDCAAVVGSQFLRGLVSEASIKEREREIVIEWLEDEVNDAN